MDADLRVAALFAEAVGTVVLTTQHRGVGGSAQGRQRAHVGVLGNEGHHQVEDGHDGRGQVPTQLGVGAAGMSGRGNRGVVRCEPAL